MTENNPDKIKKSSSTPSTPPTTKYTKREAKLDIGILLLALGFLMVGILYHTGQFDVAVPNTFEFTSDDIMTNETRKYDVGVKMMSTTYSAQVPIDVTVKLNVEKGDLPQNVYILFPNSYQYPFEKIGFAETFKTGSITTTRANDGYYHGSGKIAYPTGGCFTLFTASIRPDILDIPDNATIPCKISIADLGTTTSVRTTNIIISLEYLIAGLTILSMRPIWHAIASKYLW